MAYEVDISERVYNTDHGYAWEVRADGDGIGVRVRYIETTGDEHRLDVVPDEAVTPVACSMLRVCCATYPNAREGTIASLEKVLEDLRSLYS